MIVIPAIDIRSGNCVRLTQGKIENEIVYSKDPVFIAKLWQAQGAKRIHIVDIDGAFTGSPKNLHIVEKIRSNVNCELEFGGGVRDQQALDKIFEIGINYCILGTVAVYNPDFLKNAIQKYPGKIIVAVDALKEKVAIGGWKDVTEVSVTDLAQALQGYGLEEVMYTDVEKDGMLTGPSLGNIKYYAEKFKMKLIVSGGVSSYDDLEKIKALNLNSISGIIIGRALYTGDIKLDKAIEIVEKGPQ